GQTAQFPQIYKGFGMDTVIVGKNVSTERAPQSEFIWEGPDGTRILATRLGKHARANFFMNSYLEIMNGVDFNSSDYLFRWENAGMVYHQADEYNHIQDYFRFRHTEKIHDERIRQATERAWSATDDSLLKDDRILMDGSDSTTPQPELSALITKMNDAFEDIEFIHSDIERYVQVMKEKLDIATLRTVRGELRDGPAFACSANALMTRPYIKILNKKVQNALYRVAEPLSVISVMNGDLYDSDFLGIAIKNMLLSHPHDSINGVAQDKTADDVMYRLKQSLEIAETVSNTVCAGLAGRIGPSGSNGSDLLLVAVNTLPFERREVVKVFIDTPQDRNVWDFAFEDFDGNMMDIQRIGRKEEVVPVSDLHARPWPFYTDRHSIYFDTGLLPAGGYKAFRIVPLKTFNRKALFWADMRESDGSYLSPVANVLENAFLHITVEHNGTVTMLDKASGMEYRNLNYFEDTGDCGDYWMHYPPHNNKTFISLGSTAEIWTEDNGPLSATIGVSVRMRLPSYALRPEAEVRGESRRCDETKEVVCTIYYTLQKDARQLEVKLQVDNQVEDHRFRVLFDTGIQAKEISASGHFTVDVRPVVPIKNKEGKYFPEMQTLPMQNFVDVSDGTAGIALISSCLSEYEAMDNVMGTLALTLFRSVRNIICTEMRSAGSFPGQKGGQSLGMQEYRYAIMPHTGYWYDAGLYAQAERFSTPLKLIQTGKNEQGDLPAEKSFFVLEPEQLVMSSFKKCEDRDGLVMRLYNPTSSMVKGFIRLDCAIEKAYLTNLDEERISELPVSAGNEIEVIADTNKIITVEIQLISQSAD
ncbi:MAG: glycoside hydrolase family 38 C-terminal domain-containing protein, partial [Saccharofermentanales bacterium]